MPDNSFDIVSKIEIPEVSNAVQQAMKEIQQRYDLKDSHSSIELERKREQVDAGQQRRVLSSRRHRNSGTEAGEAQGSAEGSGVRHHHYLRPAQPSGRRSRCSKASRLRKPATS